MSGWLKDEEYLSRAPEHVGTVSIHHCRTGADNDKLFITRCEDGMILAFCHHCGKRGIKDTRASATIEEFTSVHPAKTGDKYTLPTDMQLDMADWPVEASMWIRTAGVTSLETRRSGIGYSPSFRRVVIPMFTFGALSAFQTRRVFMNAGPKYATYKNFDGLPFRAFGGKTSETKQLVICEDALSAIRCGRYYPSVALMGTHLSDIVLAYFVRLGVREFLIFMDDDNTDVRMKQQAIARRLETFGQVRVHHSEGVDPKEYGDTELRRILDNK